MNKKLNTEYHVGTKYKNGEVINKIGTFDDFADAKNACVNGYSVYDNEGVELYSNSSSSYKILLILLFLFAATTLGGTFAYLTLRDNGEQDVIKFENNMELIYNTKDGKPYPDACGIYEAPEKGYKVVFADGSSKLIAKPALIKNDGTIIENQENVKLTIDKHCNIIVRGKANITLPNGDIIQVGDGSVTNPSGVVADPNGQDNLTIDNNGNVIVGEGGAKVTLPDGTEINAPKGTIITPDGKVITPDSESNIRIGEDGKIIVEDKGATVITVKCGEKHVPKGTIILPEGTIILPNGNDNLTIDKNGYVVVGTGGATIIRDDCTELPIPPGSVITDDGNVITPKDNDNNGGGIVIDDNGNITITDPDGGTIHTPNCGDREVPSGTIRVPDGTIIVPKNISNLVTDEFGYVHVPEGGAGIILPNCTEEDVPKDTIITPDGDVLIPDGDDASDKPIVDDNGNIIFPDDGNGGTIITPECGKKDIPGGTIIVPGGTIIIPHDNTKLIVDEFGYVHIPEGGAEVILPNCTEEDAPKGTIVTPPGTVIIPGDDNNPPVINDDGLIIIDEDDDSTVVIQPEGCKITIPGGSIIYKGLVIVGTANEKPYIKDDLIVIPPGGKIIYPDCHEELFPNGGTVDDEGDSNHGLPEDPENPTPPTPPIVTPEPTPDPDPEPEPEPDPELTLSILYMEGQELNIAGVRPSNDIIGSKTFRVRNTGTGEVAFNILWTQVINNFARPQDLVVTVKMNGTIVKNEVPVPTINEIMLQNITLPKDATYDFELTFKYLETGLNQDEDQGKMFSTVIQIAGVE